MGGLAFVAADTLLPNMVNSLGGPDWMISVSPVLVMTGMLGPQLLAAHWIEQKAAMHRYVAILGLFQRSIFLMAAIGLFVFGGTMPLIALLIAVLAPLISGISSGFSIPAWSELISRTIPPEIRGSLHATRNIIGGIIALGAGWGVHEILGIFPDYRGYSLLFLLSFIFFMISWFFFIQLREIPMPERIDGASSNFFESLKMLPGLLRKDRQLRLMAIVSFFGPSIFIVIPFLAVRAIEVTGQEESFVGMLVLAKTVGVLLCNFIGGYLGNKFGGKILMLTSRVLRIVVCLLIPFAVSPAAFLVIFFLFGGSFAMNIVGHHLLSIEISPDGRRPTYVALIAAAGFPGIILVPIISASIHYLTPSMLPLAMVSLGGTVVGLLAISFIREPRKSFQSQTT